MGESKAYPGDPTFELSFLAEYKILCYNNYYITTSTVNNSTVTPFISTYGTIYELKTDL
jgi:hypothetical protein